MKKVIKNCPKCEDLMFISEFKCPSCDTVIRGQFEIDKSDSLLDRLNDEDKYFVLVFLQTGGKIQDVEKIMGISYPTVKAKLEEIQTKLKGGKGDWPTSDEFDKLAFKSEIRELKRQIRNRVRKQVKDSLSKAFDKGGKSSLKYVDETLNEIDESKEYHELSKKPESKTEKCGVNKRKFEIIDVMDKLESGEIDYETAMQLIAEL